jgi:hypothetical protein
MKRGLLLTLTQPPPAMSEHELGTFEERFAPAYRLYLP